jgi:hypothetical protein
LAPVSALSLERVRFDLQKMGNPEITEWCTSGVNWQGTKCGNTCWRSRIGSLHIAAQRTAR